MKLNIELNFTDQDLHTGMQLAVFMAKTLYIYDVWDNFQYKCQERPQQIII